VRDARVERADERRGAGERVQAVQGVAGEAAEVGGVRALLGEQCAAQRQHGAQLALQRLRVSRSAVQRAQVGQHDRQVRAPAVPRLLVGAHPLHTVSRGHSPPNNTRPAQHTVTAEGGTPDIIWYSVCSGSVSGRELANLDSSYIVCD